VPGPVERSAERAVTRADSVAGPRADSVAPMSTHAVPESVPQRLAAIRDQLKLLADYL